MTTTYYARVLKVGGWGVDDDGIAIPDYEGDLLPPLEGMEKDLYLLAVANAFGKVIADFGVPGEFLVKVFIREEDGEEGQPYGETGFSIMEA